MCCRQVGWIYTVGFCGDSSYGWFYGYCFILYYIIACVGG